MTTKLIPVTQWEQHHPWPSIAALRNLIHHKETNGFNKVIKKVGKRVLIDETAFFEWVEERNREAW